MNGGHGWNRGKRKERMREKREKDSSEIDDGFLARSKAMSKNSSHQAACQTDTSGKHTNIHRIC